jgi:hypothetical protein
LYEYCIVCAGDIPDGTPACCPGAVHPMGVITEKKHEREIQNIMKSEKNLIHIYCRQKSFFGFFVQNKFPEDIFRIFMMLL